MSYHLTVREPFSDYVRGDHIEDEAAIAKIKERSDWEHLCVQVHADNPPVASVPSVAKIEPEKIADKPTTMRAEDR